MTSTDPSYADLRILVVEDEPHIRQIIRRLLRQIGFAAIYEAGDGGEGLRELMRVRPHVVLCDIHMKPMDGMMFLSKLRQLSKPDLAKTRVIFLTADTQQDTVFLAKDLRVDGYLAKPVSQNALKARIDSVLVG